VNRSGVVASCRMPVPPTSGPARTKNPCSSSPLPGEYSRSRRDKDLCYKVFPDGRMLGLERIRRIPPVAVGRNLATKPARVKMPTGFIFSAVLGPTDRDRQWDV
jgi:hypothetical protein